MSDCKVSLDILSERIKHEREVREITERLTGLALAHQAVVYDRTLGQLNVSHELTMRDRAELLRKEVYDSFRRDFDAWKLEVATALVANRTEHTETQRRWTSVVVAVTVILNALGLLLHVLIR